MSEGRDKLIAELDRVGFFKLTEEHRAAEIRTMFVTGEGPYSEYPYIFDEATQRICPIDAENVADGFATDELLKLQEPLLRFGIDLKVEELADEGQNYVIGVNGITYLVLSAEEIDEERDWLLATQRVLAVVNRLLDSLGADERVYLLYIGELSLAVFLTPQMFDVLSESDELNPFEKPQAVDVAPIEV